MDLDFVVYIIYLQFKQQDLLCQKDLSASK